MFKTCCTAGETTRSLTVFIDYCSSTYNESYEYIVTPEGLIRFVFLSSSLYLDKLLV